MNEYKPNSHKYKELKEAETPAKKMEPVVTGDVVIRKKNALQRFADAIKSEEVPDMKRYFLEEIVFPGLRVLVLNTVDQSTGVMGDALHDIFDRLLPGKNSEDVAISSRSSARPSYQRYYDDRNYRRPSNRPQPKYDYRNNDIIVKSRGDGERVIAELRRWIRQYGMVSISDLYQALGADTTYVDNERGWTDLTHARVVRIRNEYHLQMPEVDSLD